MPVWSLMIFALMAATPVFAQPQDGGGYENPVDDYADFEDSYAESNEYGHGMSGPAEQVDYEKSDTGNPLFDLFSNKAERQKTRVTERTDDRVDNEADGYFDRKVDEFMNGIFGK